MEGGEWRVEGGVMSGRRGSGIRGVKSGSRGGGE